MNPHQSLLDRARLMSEAGYSSLSTNFIKTLALIRQA